VQGYLADLIYTACVLRGRAPNMPPQIKQDLNRSGWETTDFPSVCENCLPENPYVQMIKSDYGEGTYLKLSLLFFRRILRLEREFPNRLCGLTSVLG